MGALTSRQNAGVEEVDIVSNHAYKYPPKSGNYFGSHFIMGGERFDTPQPEAYLFGENADLNFLGSRPTPFPYPPPQANKPTKTLKSLVNIRKESLRLVRAVTNGKGDGDIIKPTHFNIEFTFDCDCRTAITIYYFATEEVSPNGVVTVKSLEKDKLIQRLSQDWAKVKKFWEEVNNRHKNLVQDLQTEREMSRQKNLEISKKVEQWNVEVAHALQLAAGYKQLNDTLNSERKAWKKEMDKRIVSTQKQLTLIQAQNEEHYVQKQKLEEQLEESKYDAVEMTLIQDLERRTTAYTFVERSLVQKTQVEISRAREHISEREAEIAELREQKRALLRELEREKSVANSIRQQNYEIQNSLSEVMKNQTEAANQLNSYRGQLESSKSELRNFYSNQLAATLDAMWKAFKNKLNNTEVILKAEYALKEKEIKDIAIKNQQLLAERHREDIKELQEKFKTRIAELKMKLSESEQKRICAETRLNRKTIWKENLVEQLHDVIQTQRKEAFNILTSVNTQKYDNHYQEAERDWPGGI